MLNVPEYVRLPACPRCCHVKRSGYATAIIPGAPPASKVLCHVARPIKALLQPFTEIPCYYFILEVIHHLSISASVRRARSSSHDIRTPSQTGARLSCKIRSMSQRYAQMYRSVHTDDFLCFHTSRTPLPTPPPPPPRLIVMSANIGYAISPSHAFLNIRSLSHAWR